MSKDRLDSYAKGLLELRNLVPRHLRTGVVQICADDGSANGFPIGWAEKAPHPYYRRLTWQTVVRGVPGDDDSYWQGGLARRAKYSPSDHGGHETLGRAIQEILTLAMWGDALAAHEIRAGRAGTYTATMDETKANWFARLYQPEGITHLGGGRMRFTNVAIAYFRGNPEVRAYVDANDVFHLNPLDPTVPLTRER
ncbi:hypothetical protein [Amycolatopsis benzoatilytica]|uniref:hypothetical protein n=1 Tax=Amycolatopsis benzoatilytica TaxID=346045 RepID=UPI0012B68A82|nr:hypothetical protein [Amycolatopsis benzoatilytica]